MLIVDIKEYLKNKLTITELPDDYTLTRITKIAFNKSLLKNVLKSPLEQIEESYDMDFIYPYVSYYIKRNIDWIFNLKKIDELVDAIQEGKGFFIIGAGVSYEADIDPNLKRCLIQTFILTFKKSRREEVKKQLEKDISSLWEKIISSKNSKKTKQKRLWHEFKKTFKTNIEQIDPALSHKIIAELYLSKYIYHIVTFNQDDLIERASNNRIKAVIGDDCIPLEDKKIIWKPHGCVTNDEVPWILPYEKGKVPKELLNRLKKEPLKRIYYVLVDIGYSGRDKAAVNLFKLVKKYGKERYSINKYPIRNFHKNVITLSAEESLKEIFVRLFLKGETKLGKLPIFNREIKELCKLYR